MKPKVLWKSLDGQTRLVAITESDSNEGEKYSALVSEELGENALEEPSWFRLDASELEDVLTQFAIDYANQEAGKQPVASQIPNPQGFNEIWNLTPVERALYNSICQYSKSFAEGSPDVYEHSKEVLEAARDWYHELDKEANPPKKGG